MGCLSVVSIVSVAGLCLVYGFPINTTPSTHRYDSQDSSAAEVEWGKVASAGAPALALAFLVVGLLIGCTWCYRRKEYKLNEVAGNQFTASVSQLQESRRSQPPDSGFSEPSNNNVSEDNNNGPISLREMQNIANNNAAAYIVSENEERNGAVSRESVIVFEPLPAGLRPLPDPLAQCADWFESAEEEISRNALQYLREIGRGWFGRVVEGDIDSAQNYAQNKTVAFKILNQDADLMDKARYLNESKMYRDVRHDNVLMMITHCLQEDPWILIFEYCSMNLHQFLTTNIGDMEKLNKSAVGLRLQCEIASALSFIHSRNFVYGNLWSGNILVRGDGDSVHAVVGRYEDLPPPSDAWAAPELHHRPTISSDVWSLGTVLWEVCSWGATPTSASLAEPATSCPYYAHMYQVMQLCWNLNPDARPTVAQIETLLNHLYTTHQSSSETCQDVGYGSNDFEERWQKIKPNSVPKVDEHIAIVHGPSVSTASHFSGSDLEFDNAQTVQDVLSVELDTAISRSSSIMSDKDPLSVQLKSESLTNLHGSLEDVRHMYLSNSEKMSRHVQDIMLDRDTDNSDSSDLSKVDPWLKDIIASSQDDVSYYRDVSDVMKNLDNILNSEKTSSSESSHQASPLRDNLVLDCKKDSALPSSLVKSPGISNFQNIFEQTPEQVLDEPNAEDDLDREGIGVLNHSFERCSGTDSLNTLENITPDTPHKDIDSICYEEQLDEKSDHIDSIKHCEMLSESTILPSNVEPNQDAVPSSSHITNLRSLCLATISSNNSSCEKYKDVKCAMDYSQLVCDNITDTIHNKDCELNKLIPASILVDNIESCPNIIEERASDNYGSEIKDLNDEKCIETIVPHDLTQESNVSDGSTVYMDLINYRDSELFDKINVVAVKNNVKDDVDSTINNSDSTKYLDLPSFTSLIDETNEFLNSERSSCYHSMSHERHVAFSGLCASTPKGSIFSTIEGPSNTIDFKQCKEMSLNECPNYGPGVTVNKLNQMSVPEAMSPLDSPTKSQPTDTFDENSSVVLGPFENCTLDLFKGVKSSAACSEFVEVPKEELLAYSGTYTDLDLETPSPLRDANFLQEVPDINEVNGENLPQSMTTIESPMKNHHLKPIHLESNHLNIYDLHLPPLSPTTPPNSPGKYHTISPEPRYLIENLADPLLDNLPDPIDECNDIDNQDDVNEIDIQTTTNLAMAENDNNLNMECSGPFIINESDSLPIAIEPNEGDETYLSGNGGCLGKRPESPETSAEFEESLRALRNELEIKLVLAQSINIEPETEKESWSYVAPQLELVVNYVGALSPILEETKLQLSAYENDRLWVVSKTESSESYLEPCNNSTDEVTDLPTGAVQSVPKDDPTYALDYDIDSHPSTDNHTYTIHKDKTTSKEITMSQDSLNQAATENLDMSTPSQVKTYVVDCNLERISQVSPFILSPTTDSSVPENVQSENITGVSTLSKLTGATDAKSSKPSETQCLSKATSIDSWCSNDTLFNVDDNFDDLAIEPDVDIHYEVGAEINHSHSTDTLTHHDDEKELSNCSTYIVHDDKSDDDLTPNSIELTYTKNKMHTDDKTTPSIITKSEINNVTNSPSKDLAYGTLASGLNSNLASCSNNCITPVSSEPEHDWINCQPPEMIRRSPGADIITFSPPPTTCDVTNTDQKSPMINHDMVVKRMDSVEISCLSDDLLDNLIYKGNDQSPNNILENYPEKCFSYIAQNAQSTPLVEIKLHDDIGDEIPLNLPCNYNVIGNLAELRPQDISSLEITNSVTDLPLEVESQNSGSGIKSPHSIHSYSAFQMSAVCKPQEVNSSAGLSASSQNSESGATSTDEFNNFKSSIQLRPQDLNDQGHESIETLVNDNKNIKELSHMSDSKESSYVVKENVKTEYDDSKGLTSYIDFQMSAIQKPQEIHSSCISTSNRNSKCPIGPTEEFVVFKNSIELRPQDLSELETSAHIEKQEIKSNPSSSKPDLENVAETYYTDNFVKVIENIEVTRSKLQNNMPNDTLAIQINVSEPNEHEKLLPESNIETIKNENINETFDSHANISGDSYNSHTSRTESIDIKQIQSPPSPELNIGTIQSESVNQKICSCVNICGDCNSLHNGRTEDTVGDHDSNKKESDDNELLQSEPLLNHSTETVQNANVNTKCDSHVNISDKTPMSHNLDVSKDNGSENAISQFEPLPEFNVNAIKAMNINEKCDSHVNISDETPMSHNLDVSKDNGSENAISQFEPLPEFNVNAIKAMNINEKCDSHVNISDETPMSHNLDVSKDNGSENAISQFGPLPEFNVNAIKDMNINAKCDSHVNIIDDANNLHTSSMNDIVGNNNRDQKFYDIQDSSVIEPNVDAIQDENINKNNDSHVNVSDGSSNLHTSITTDIIKNNSDEIYESDVQQLPNNECGKLQPQNSNNIANSSNEKFATVNYLNETFEELVEGRLKETISEGDICNGDDSAEQNCPRNNDDIANCEDALQVVHQRCYSDNSYTETVIDKECDRKLMGHCSKLTSATEDFLINEKHFCLLESYLPLLNDIRFSGPGDDCMTTSFNQESLSDDKTGTLDGDENKVKENGTTASEIIKDWDSDCDDSHSSNSSSGDFIWKDGDGHETCVVPSTHFQHQHEQQDGGGDGKSGATSSCGDSASGSEGDELEFVPSSWDCSAAPGKSSLRSFEQTTPDSKKRVVFKRQKYHCVYEYPREVPDVGCESLVSPYLPDYSTYADWDAASAEEAEMGYGQLFDSHPLELFPPLQAGFAFGSDYDEDFFISSSARPFESLGIMSTSSQFFPGMHALKGVPLEPDMLLASPNELPTATAPAPTKIMMPSLDFTTPDSGVEDITPGSTTTDEETRQLPITDLTTAQCWRSGDSVSSSESVSPSSPAAEALGGLRHTRDKLKLDLPPSPHIPSPRQNRVFNFILDKPKSGARTPVAGDVPEQTTPIVMTDNTPMVTSSLPLEEGNENVEIPEPTFSTFGKGLPKTTEPEKPIVLNEVEETESNDVAETVGIDVEDKGSAEESEREKFKSSVEVVKGEGTVLDSGDEDSGIESSAQATLERNKPSSDVS